VHGGSSGGFGWVFWFGLVFFVWIFFVIQDHREQIIKAD